MILCSFYNNTANRKVYPYYPCYHFLSVGGGRVVRWCWVNFQCRRVLRIWIRVGQGPTVCACSRCGWGLFGHVFLSSIIFSFLSPSLWETGRYRLKYCLKGPLSPKQPTKPKSYLQQWCVYICYVSRKIC